MLHIDLRLSNHLQNDKHRSNSTVPKAHFLLNCLKFEFKVKKGKFHVKVEKNAQEFIYHAHNLNDYFYLI